MAFSFVAKTPLFSFTNFQRHPLTYIHTKRAIMSNIHVPKPIKCMSIANEVKSSQDVVRRSANYERSIWDDDYIMSLNSDYTGDMYRKRAEMLKEKVRDMIGNVNGPLDQLELIDTLQRIGLGYHFEDEIKMMLKQVYDSGYGRSIEDGLYGVSLAFRLFRQHRFRITQEVFIGFKDGACVCDDVKEMLSLYEASHYGFEGESIMEEACQFTTQHLQNLKFDTLNTNLALEVKHALELPLHRRVNRVEARWFIDHYHKKDDSNPILLELAKLDFNILQGLHQQELKEAFTWWKQSDLGDSELGFSRDSLVISYIWTLTIAFEPKYSSFRILNTKINNLLTSIDDIYDVYGTLEELQLFSKIVQRWDIQAMKDLPSYMRIYFFAFYNLVNQMTYDILKEQDLDVSTNIQKSWTGLLETYLLEAKWFHSGYKPTMEEYIENGLVSVTVPIMLINNYLSVANPIVKEELEYLESNAEIVICLCKIRRLQNDLGNSSDEVKRGDVRKSVQCIMNESGASEEEARELVKDMIRELWIKVNAFQATDKVLSETTIKFMLNVGRTYHCVYLHGDGHAVQKNTKAIALPLLFEPIPI